MSTMSFNSIIRTTVCTLTLGAVLTAFVPSITWAQEEKILLLSFPLKNDGKETTVAPVATKITTQPSSRSAVQISPSRQLFRNLVLYLYAPLGSRPIIERAAISISDSSDLGSEMQELTELRGVEFHRNDFLLQETWLRDLNFDGYTDLILPNGKTQHAKNIYLFDNEKEVFTPDLNGEYLAEPRIVENSALNQPHPTLLR